MPLARLGPDLAFEYDLEGDGEPVVLVCGLGVHRNVWCEVVETLAPRYQVLTYDLRGYSGVCPVDDFTIADLAQDLARLLDLLDLGPVHLVGHSQGGFIALEAALARPDLVRSLVVAGSASYTDEYGRRVLDHWRRTLLAEGQRAFFRTLFLWQYSPDYFNDRTRELDVMEKWLVRSPLRVDAYLAHNRACASHETRDRLGAVRAPVLLLGGAEDRVMGLRHNELLQRLIPHARRITLERLAHDLFVESPERTVPLIEDFLGGLARPRAVAAVGGAAAARHA
jgi:pimeloyl-ACP methyl ester carboxylesterase